MAALIDSGGFWIALTLGIGLTASLHNWARHAYRGRQTRQRLYRLVRQDRERGF